MCLTSLCSGDRNGCATVITRIPREKDEKKKDRKVTHTHAATHQHTDPCRFFFLPLVMSIRHRAKPPNQRTPPHSAGRRAWSDDDNDDIDDGQVTILIEEEEVVAPLHFPSYLLPSRRTPPPSSLWMIPDKYYQERALGRSRRRDQGFRITQRCCANCCTGFSVVAFLFLVRHWRKKNPPPRRNLLYSLLLSLFYKVLCRLLAGDPTIVHTGCPFRRHGEDCVS